MTDLKEQILKDQVEKLIPEEGTTSVRLIAKKLNITEDEANRIIDKLCSEKKAERGRW